MDRDVIDPGLAEVAEFKPYQRESTGNRGGRRSPFDIKMDMIKADEGKHGKSYAIQSYANEDTARQSLGNLKRRHGFDSSAYGWDLQLGDVGDGRLSLIVRYAPSDVVEGGAEAHVAKVEERKRARVTAVPNGSNDPLSEDAAAEHPEAPQAEDGSGKKRHKANA